MKVEVAISVRNVDMIFSFRLSFAAMIYAAANPASQQFDSRGRGVGENPDADGEDQSDFTAE